MKWKLAGFTVWMSALALAIPYALSESRAQRNPRIEITSTLEQIRTVDGQRVLFYLLWNRKITERPIGHAFYSCQLGIYGAQICTGIFSLPYGRIVALGEIHSLRRHSFVITGGSRSVRAKKERRPGYTHAAGTIGGWRVGPGTYALAFSLEP